MERTVRLTPATIGDVAQGYRLSSVNVSPSTVRIAGPRSLVRTIAEISTDVIDLTGLTANKALSSPGIQVADRSSSREAEPHRHRDSRAHHCGENLQ